MEFNKLLVLWLLVNCPTELDDIVNQHVMNCNAQQQVISIYLSISKSHGDTILNSSTYKITHDMLRVYKPANDTP